MNFIAAIKSLFGIKSGPVPLNAGDRSLICEDCRQPFVFDVGEQRFFKTKGFTDPKRCPYCRKKVKSHLHKRFKTRRKEKGGGRGFGRRHSLIDGESPYADER